MPKYVLSYKTNNNIKELIWNNDYKTNYDLKSIDNFTSLFLDKEELMKYFYKNNGLDESKGNFGIYYRSNGTVKKIRYDIIYNEDKCFLDIDYIKRYFIDNTSNTVLLEKLCNKYEEYYNQGKNVSNIRLYLNNVVDEKTMMYSLIDIVNRECYKYDNKEYCYKTDELGNKIVNYRGLHDLAAFLIYNNKVFVNKKNKTKQIDGQMSLF